MIDEDEMSTAAESFESNRDAGGAILCGGDLQ